MCDDSELARLYASVLEDDIQKFGLTSSDIWNAIQNIKEVYIPDPTSLTAGVLDVANYNDPAHRCAYVHKSAAFHTALVADMFRYVLKQSTSYFSDIILNTGHMNICSLGGGPGSDVIGVCSVLHATFGNFQISATIIDCMIEWRQTFGSIVRELKRGGYGSFGDYFRGQDFSWSYLGSNLLGAMPNDVHRAISSADLVTMIKFVSACSSKDTSAMMKKIFNSLKPGALVLYIDNAGGVLHKLVTKEANGCNLVTVFEPKKHYAYANETFKEKKFGYTPKCETKVTLHVWRKPYQNEPTHINVVTDRFLSRKPTRKSRYRRMRSARHSNGDDESQDDDVEPECCVIL